MQLTKEDLTKAHEQGLSVQTNKGNIKIVSILGDVYGVNHCDTNSKLVKLWMFENFERNQATIEQHKPKIDFSILKEGEIYYGKTNNYEWVFKVESLNKDNIYCIILDINSLYKCKEGLHFKYEFKELSLPNENQLNLFYSQFPELKPKKYIQGFEVKDGYNDVVMCSFDNKIWHTRVLKSILNDRFIDNHGNAWKFARYPRKEEINEIKFVD